MLWQLQIVFPTLSVETNPIWKMQLGTEKPYRANSSVLKTFPWHVWLLRSADTGDPSLTSLLKSTVRRGDELLLYKQFRINMNLWSAL